MRNEMYELSFFVSSCFFNVEDSLEAKRLSFSSKNGLLELFCVALNTKHVLNDAKAAQCSWSTEPLFEKILPLVFVNVLSRDLPVKRAIMAQVLCPPSIIDKLMGEHIWMNRESLVHWSQIGVSLLIFVKGNLRSLIVYSKSSLEVFKGRLANLLNRSPISNAYRLSPLSPRTKQFKYVFMPNMYRSVLISLTVGCRNECPESSSVRGRFRPFIGREISAIDIRCVYMSEGSPL